MSLTALLFLVIALTLTGWYFGQQRALVFRRTSPLHSQPRYHGAYVALWAGLPALFVLLLWTAVSPGIIDNRVAVSYTEVIGQTGSSNVGLMLNEVKNVAEGNNIGDKRGGYRKQKHIETGCPDREYQIIRHQSEIGLRDSPLDIGQWIFPK